MQLYPNCVNSLWRLYLPLTGMSFERDSAMGEMLSCYDCENEGVCIGSRQYLPHRDFFDQCCWLVSEAVDDEQLTEEQGDRVMREIMSLRYGWAIAG